MEIEKRELYNFIVEEDFNGGYKVIKGPLDKLTFGLWSKFRL